jgi:hypothetical protein
MTWRSLGAAGGLVLALTCASTRAGAAPLSPHEGFGPSVLTLDDLVILTVSDEDGEAHRFARIGNLSFELVPNSWASEAVLRTCLNMQGGSPHCENLYGPVYFPPVTATEPPDDPIGFGVPEPGSLVLFGIAAAACARRLRKLRTV